MAKLTEQFSNITGRVNALETSQLDDNAPITQIFKIYEDLGIKVKITASIHQYNICSPDLYCSEELII